MKNFISIIFILLFVVLGSENVITQQDNSMPQPDLISEAGYLYSAGKLLLAGDQYDSAINCFYRASDIFLQSNLQEKYILSIIGVAEAQRIKGKTDEAEKTLNLITEYSKNLISDTDSLFAAILFHKATNNLVKGNYNVSNDLFVRVIDILSNISPAPDSMLAICYSNTGTTYFYLNDYETAKNNYLKAIEYAQSSDQDNTIDIAAYYLNIGIIYAIEGDFEDARRYFQQSLNISKEILQPNDPDLAYLYHNLGRLDQDLGKFDEALSHYNKAENIYLEKFGDDYFTLGGIYMNKGNIYRSSSDFEKALEYYRFSLAFYEKNFNNDHPDIPKILNNIGTIHFERKEYHKALEYFNQSLQINRSVFYEVATLRNIAKTYQHLNDYPKAEKYFKEAISRSEIEIGKGHIELGISYLQYGQYLTEAGDKDAIIQFRNAERIFLDSYGKYHPELSNSYLAIADQHLGQSNYNEALYFYQKAIISLDSSFTDSNIYANPGNLHGISAPNYMSPLKGKANVLREIYLRDNDLEKLEMSFKTWADLIQLTDYLRTIITDRSEIIIAENLKSNYVETIKTAMMLYSRKGDIEYAKQAFSYAEKSKAAVLLSSIRNVEALDFGGMPDSLRTKEKDLKGKIAAYRRFIYEENINTEPDNDKIRTWEGLLFRTNQEYEALISEFESGFPQYYSLKYNNKVAGVEEIQGNLNENEALLEYVMADSILYIFCIGKNSLDVEEIPFDSLFVRDIKYYLKALSKKDFSEHGKDDYIREALASFNIYNHLLAPVSDKIKGKDLIIIPDDILGYLSFEALITKFPDTSEMNYRNLDYLINDYLVNYSYLATLKYSKQHKKASPGREALAFAPSYDNIKDIDPERLLSIRGLESYLVPLPYSVEEIENISKLIKTATFLGTAATEANFKKNIAGKNIIHLAMHTIIDNENPMFSKLAFSLNNEGPEDGFLNTYEIYNMDIDAEMVVLSACNTGYGKLRKGEGIISLARGFLYAGVPGIVMTLWAIEDRSSASIMTSFYEKLKEGKQRHEALREAKLDYLEKAGQLHSHPYFWSAYVNIGDTGVIYKKTHTLWYIISVCVLLIFVILFFRYLRKKPAS